MQAVEQPKKSKLWALLSGILGISWGTTIRSGTVLFSTSNFLGSNVYFILFIYT